MGKKRVFIKENCMIQLVLYGVMHLIYLIVPNQHKDMILHNFCTFCILLVLVSLK